MARRGESAEQTPIVARNRVIERFRQELRVAIIVQRRMSVEELEKASGVAARAIRTYMANDATEAREPSTSAMLSIAVVLGERCVNAVLALIGYGGAVPLDEPSEPDLMPAVANAMTELGTLAQCAVTGANHQNKAAVQEAADRAIHDLLPFASAGHAE